METLITRELRDGPRTTREAILKTYLDGAGYTESSNEYKNLIIANSLYQNRIKMLDMPVLDLDGGKCKKNKRSLRKRVKRRRRTIRRRSIRRRSIRRRR